MTFAASVFRSVSHTDSSLRNSSCFSNAAAKALSGYYIKLYFRNVQPASMLWRIMYFQFFYDTPCFLRRILNGGILFVCIPFTNQMTWSVFVPVWVMSKETAERLLISRTWSASRKILLPISFTPFPIVTFVRPAVQSFPRCLVY